MTQTSLRNVFRFVRPSALDGPGPVGFSIHSCVQRIRASLPASGRGLRRPTGGCGRPRLKSNAVRRGPVQTFPTAEEDRPGIRWTRIGRRTLRGLGHPQRHRPADLHSAKQAGRATVNLNIGGRRWVDGQPVQFQTCAGPLGPNETLGFSLTAKRVAYGFVSRLPGLPAGSGHKPDSVFSMIGPTLISSRMVAFRRVYGSDAIGRRGLTSPDPQISRGFGKSVVTYGNSKHGSFPMRWVNGGLGIKPVTGRMTKPIISLVIADFLGRRHRWNLQGREP